MKRWQRAAKGERPDHPSTNRKMVRENQVGASQLAWAQRFASKRTGPRAVRLPAVVVAPEALSRTCRNRESAPMNANQSGLGTCFARFHDHVH